MNRSSGARVALIPYFNSAPFFLHWGRIEQASGGRWRSLVLPPRQLGQAAARGEVDAGLMSLVDLFRLEADFEPMAIPSPDGPGHFGIAARNRVDSVLLFLRQDRGARFAEDREGDGRARTLLPEEAAGLRGVRIGVTTETATSVLLLRLLLEVRHHSVPRSYVPLDLNPAGGPVAGPPAALVIGDTALCWQEHPPAGYVLGMDLAAEWHAWTGLPFVFACWAARRNLALEDKEWMARFLQASLDEAGSNLRALAEGRPKEMGSPERLARYLEGFTYRLGPQEEEAIARFRTLLLEFRLLADAD